MVMLWQKRPIKGREFGAPRDFQLGNMGATDWFTSTYLITEVYPRLGLSRAKYDLILLQPATDFEGASSGELSIQSNPMTISAAIDLINDTKFGILADAIMNYVVMQSLNIAVDYWQSRDETTQKHTDAWIQIRS